MGQEQAGQVADGTGQEDAEGEEVDFVELFGALEVEADEEGAGGADEPAAEAGAPGEQAEEEEREHGGAEIAHEGVEGLDDAAYMLKDEEGHQRGKQAKPGGQQARRAHGVVSGRGLPPEQGASHVVEDDGGKGVEP